VRAKAIANSLMAIVVVTIAVSAFAQTDPRRDNDRIVIPKGETEIQYRKPGDVPRQIGAAIGAACDYKSRIGELPIRIVRLGSKQIALVPCSGIVVNSIAFTIERGWKPSPIYFVVRSPPNGFGSTRTPGFLEWHQDTQTFTATEFTDVTPGREWRHIYRYSSDEFPFVLTRIEHRSKSFGSPDQPWVSYWESPSWSQPK
jgi:hypothetical protein